MYTILRGSLDQELTGVEHKKRMGPNYPVTRGKNKAVKRGTWLHAYPPGAENLKGKKHRLTVTHTKPKPKKKKPAAAKGATQANPN